MSKEKSRKSRNSSNQLQPLRQRQSLQIPASVLAPIYDKVQLLRREMENRAVVRQQVQPVKQELYTKTNRDYFLQLAISRDMEIEKLRKSYESLNHPSQTSIETAKQRASITVMNWKEHERNKTKSLVHFLSSNKIVRRIPSKKEQQQPHQPVIENEEAVIEHFQPLGQEYKREKLYQETLKSQTQSVSSLRPESSLRSSKIIAGSMPRQSSKKYLRKGTRVRQILMRQLKTPDQRGSSASSGLTYLKQYDQWVPTTMVEQKKAELEAFMSILFGEKRAKGVAVDLEKVSLIYL